MPNIYGAKENKSLTDAQKSVEYLRYTIKQYRIMGTTPPVKIFLELSMAKLLAKLESIDTMRVKRKAMYED